MMFAILLLILTLVINNTVNAFSACDEIDITFVVDTNNVIHNTDAVIEFIVSIINDGSSEQTGFSVVVYDDNIPNDFDIKLIKLTETATITQRIKAESEVENTLEKKFNQLVKFAKTGKKGKKVGLLDAFKVGNKQHRPTRDLNYKTRLGYAKDDKTIGGNDDDKVYFIFDYHNRLIDSDMSDICQLFHHLDTNAVKNDDEQIHFLLGEMFTKSEINKINCKHKKPEQIKWNTFYEFEDELVFNKDIMEQIYDITCPATIQAPKFGGSMNLGNHVQYLDIETVIKCNLVYYNFGSKTRQDQLDITKSYIKVKDFLNDDNTFKKNDYLLTIEKHLDFMKKVGCEAPVVKIVKIKKSKKIYDKGKPKQYQILHVYVTLPKSPMEYLLDCKIKGDSSVAMDEKHTDKYNNPYNSAYNDEFYGISIETAGMEYADSLNEDELYEYINNGMNKAITHIDNDDYDSYDSSDNDDWFNSYDEEESDQEMESIFEFYNLGENEFAEFEDSDIDELYEIYDEYMYWKYGIETSWPSWSSLKKAASGAASWVGKKASSGYNAVKKKAAAGYNAAKKKVQQAKAYGTKKLQQAKQAAVKTLNKVKNVAKKGYDKAKKYAKEKVEQVKQVAKDIYNKKLSVKKTKHLKDLNFKGDYKWEKTATGVKNIKGASGMKVTCKGSGRVTINYGYSFNFKMSVSFNFDWQIFKGNVHIEIKLHGDWDIMAYANMKIWGKLDVIIKNILNYGHTFTIWVYGVPVVLRPYVQLDKKLKMIPIEVYAGVKCKYAQNFLVGYYYDNTVTPKKSYAIKNIKTTSKGCTREFRLQESQNEGQQCPVAQLGFDIIVEATIGIEVYYIINTNLKFQFVIPFRITLPEKKLKYCKKKGDFCATTDKGLFASFTYSMKLNIYRASYIDTKKFKTVIKGLFKKQKPKPQKLPKPKGVKVGSMTILPKRSLGCINLAAMKPLNDHYRKQCCNGNTAAEGNEGHEEGNEGDQGEQEGHESEGGAEKGSTNEKGGSKSGKQAKTSSKKRGRRPSKKRTPSKKPRRSRVGTSTKKRGRRPSNKRSSTPSKRRASKKSPSTTRRKSSKKSPSTTRRKSSKKSPSKRSVSTKRTPARRTSTGTGSSKKI